MKKYFILILLLYIAACKNEDLKTESKIETHNIMEIRKDNVFEGTWFNSKFLEFIRKKKSIYDGMNILQYYPMVSFQFNSDTLNYFCASLTEGALSKLIIDSLFVDNEWECIGLNNENLSEICYKNKQLLLKGNSIPKESEFIKISNSFHDYDSLLQILFCKELFEGKYIDLEKNDTVMISNNKIHFSNSNIHDFKIGLEFLSMSFDYIEILDSKQVVSEFYHFSFKDNVLILKLLEYVNDKDNYNISNQKSYKLIKIIN